MNDEQSIYERHKKELLAGLVVFAILALIIGLMLAWFFGQKSASTVGAIKAPTAIAIYGPNQTYMEQFDLSYDPKEVEDGEVTIKRPFTIVSPTDNIVLYIAHTTNITDLVINIYSAEDVTGKETSTGDDPIKGVDSRGQEYVWKLNKSKIWTLGAKGVSNGVYLNKDGTYYKAVDSEDENSLRFKVFSNGDRVHQNADPLYWKPDGKIKLQNINGSFTSNFVIEATWKESVKETDVIYLIAKST